MNTRNWDWLDKLLEPVRFIADPSIVVLIGLPLVGKSTLARSAGARFGLGHLSTGDWFRDQIAKETILGQQVKRAVLNGDLLSSRYAQYAIAKKLTEDFSVFRQGIMFDGFPRNYEQAQLLEDFAARFGLPIKLVLHLSSPVEDLLIRADMRRVCSNRQCKEPYGWALPPVTTAGICNRCQSALIFRPDDNLPIVRKRIQEGAPRDGQMAEYYRRRGLLKVIEAGNNVELPDMLMASMQELGSRLNVKIG
jgi:adenylate kinase